MAVLDPLHPLQSSIIEIIIGSPGIKVADLHDQLGNKWGVGVSLPNLYRTIGQLTEKQVLVKERGRLSLNLVWVSHFVRLGETINRNYMAEKLSIGELPEEEGTVCEYWADSLVGLDPTWNHMLMQMVETSGSKQLYAYNSHPWYSLGMRDTEVRFYESLIERLGRFYMLYGSDSFLDRYGQKLIQLEGFHSALSIDTPFLSKGYAFWVCGPYILEVEFPEVISRNFNFFFQTVQAIEQFDPELFTDIFKMKARCKVSISNEKAKAEVLRQKLGRYFSK